MPTAVGPKNDLCFKSMKQKPAPPFFGFGSRKVEVKEAPSSWLVILTDSKDKKDSDGFLKVSPATGWYRTECWGTGRGLREGG